jgi:hypothetical protein
LGWHAQNLQAIGRPDRAGDFFRHPALLLPERRPFFLNAERPAARRGAERQRLCVGGPGRTRTCNQGIHLAPPFPTGVDYLFTRESTNRLASGAGRSRLSSRALEPSGSLCTFRRCTAGLAQGCHRSRRSRILRPRHSRIPAQHDRKGSLNSSRPLRGFRREGTATR